MNLGSPVNTPVHLGAQPSFAGYQSPVPGVQPQFHSTMVGAGGAIGQSMTPLGQSPVVAGSQMQPGNPGTPGFLPGYLIGSFPQQVNFKSFLLGKISQLSVQPFVCLSSLFVFPLSKSTYSSVCLSLLSL